jgi:hypothetical protein
VGEAAAVRGPLEDLGIGPVDVISPEDLSQEAAGSASP